MPATPQAEYDQNNKELVSLKINVAEIIRSAGIIVFDDSLAAYRTLHPDQTKAFDFFLQEAKYTAEVAAAVNTHGYDFSSEELYPLMCRALEAGEKLEGEPWVSLEQDLEQALWLARVWHGAVGDVFGFQKA